MTTTRPAASPAALARYQPGSTVAAILLSAVQNCPHRASVIDPAGVVRTYDELVDRALRLGAGLAQLGVQRGDRVAAWMADSSEYIELYAACALAGFVVVPVNARYTEHEARTMVDDAQAGLLVHTAGLAEAVGRLRRARPQLRTVAVGGTASDAESDYETLVAGSNPSEPVPAQADDLFILGYTSGTTGRPKGAMLTQGSVAALARMNSLSYRLTAGSIGALTGSMSFVATVPAHVISHFYVRGTLCVLGKWDVESLLVTTERHGVNFLYVPSPRIDEFTRAAAAQPQRWRSLDVVLHSASSASAEQLHRLADVVGTRLVEGWGMTEHSGGLMTATTPADVRAVPAGGVDRLGTVGRAVAEVDIRLVDEAGKPLPHDGVSVGELQFSSPALMAGYWEQPDATAAVLRDGWFASGDLGKVDAEGYVTILERRDDLIVSGGMNVYPAEVEHCIAALAGVVDCAVIGRPDPTWGQSVTACVVREPGTELDEAMVVQHCRTYLASYKKPTRVVFLDELPRTASLKVSRAGLRKQFA